MEIDPELAQLSRTIDPVVLGARLKTARIAAGLTQGELAGSDASTAYISRIEAGNRRPELHLLATFAARSRTSLEELLIGIPRNRMLELELEVDYAELAHTAGNANDALARVQGALPELRDSTALSLTRRAERVQALALESLGQLDEAIVVLEKITQSPRPDGDWLRELIALSRCYRESGDFQRAIASGERAQSLISELGLEGTTEAIQLSLTVGAAYMQQGDLGHAMRTCVRALEDADRTGSAIARASAYWNASLVQARRGATSEALDMAKRALTLWEQENDTRNLGRLRVDVAGLHLKADPSDPLAALALLDQAQTELNWSSASALDKADLLLVRARAHLGLGEPAKAEEFANASGELSAGTAPLLAAEAQAVLGQVAALRGDSPAARTAFQEAVHTLTASGADREAAQLWFELGELLEAVGATAEAGNCYRRAAASTGLRARPATLTTLKG